MSNATVEALKKEVAGLHPRIAAVSCVYETAGIGYVARAKLEGSAAGCAASGTSEEQALNNLKLTIRAYFKSIGEE